VRALLIGRYRDPRDRTPIATIPPFEGQRRVGLGLLRSPGRTNQTLPRTLWDRVERTPPMKINLLEVECNSRKTSDVYRANRGAELSSPPWKTRRRPCSASPERGSPGFTCRNAAASCSRHAVPFLLILPATRPRGGPAHAAERLNQKQERKPARPQRYARHALPCTCELLRRNCLIYRDAFGRERA